MTDERKPGRKPAGKSDDPLRTGGALKGGLWRDVVAGLPTRSTTSSEHSDDADPGALPLQIGSYQIIGLLGSGGMGDVFLAFDDRLQRHVAIKRIRAGRMMNAKARERLRREAAAAATLNHPAIIQIYDILDEPDGEAIVMEYVDGYTLAQILAAGRIPAHRAVGIARQVAEGLEAAHAVGLIHRDLKTQNVMVTPSGQAKILDFGLAKRLVPSDDQELTAEGSVLGTARAMSPEQAEGRALDPRSDLFSLGVLIYEVCTGRSPFEGSSAVQTLHNVIALPAPDIAGLNPDLPAALVSLVEDLLEKDPERRPSSAAQVTERLAEIELLPELRKLELPHARGMRFPPVPLSAAPLYGRERPASFARRASSHRTARRWPWVVAVGLAVLAAALLFAFWRWAFPSRPLAVVVQEPIIQLHPPDDGSRFAAFVLREAASHALAGLEGIDLIGPDELAEPGVLPPQAALHAVAADEVVRTTVACEGQRCRVSLRRQAGNGRVVADSGSFDVSSASEDSLALANAVGMHLRSVYKDHPPRSVEERLKVQPDDYAQFLLLRRASEAGQVLGRTQIDQLEELGRSSPGLTEAQLLAVGVARRFLRDPARADKILQEAEAHHPSDPRLVYERFLLRLGTGDLGAAEAAVAELEQIAPGDVRVSRARARLLVSQGRLAEAAKVSLQMVRERPSWRNLWYLADIEIDLVDEPAARQHLDQLLELSPGNPRGLEKKAELEWQMGDPAKAALIYEDLLNQEVTFVTLLNLGWSRLLARDYAGAIAANRWALDLEAADDDLLAQLNLGVAYEGMGDKDAALPLYRGLLDRLAAGKGRFGLDEQLLRAQALARLGRCVEAITVSKKALEAGQPSAQSSFRAAIIHAVCREENHAIVYATEARDRGLSAWWFGIPGFETLRARPEFRELLGPRPARPAPTRGPS